MKKLLWAALFVLPTHLYAEEPTSQPSTQPSAPTTQAAASLPAEAPPIEEEGDYGLVVTGQRPMTAASSSKIRNRDFLLRDHLRPADILMLAPGMFVVQHAGGGKANQYFLRGFDADHGTDVALFVDGVPINMVSHGHGQGYADLHFIIPETIESLEVYKGPYFAEFGDFATAGAFNLVTKSGQTKSEFSLTGGSFNTLRSLVQISPNMKGFSPYLAAEIYTTDGPFNNPEDLLRYNLFSKLGGQLPWGAKLSAVVMAYGAGWNASGQIPQREVNAGRLDRFGTIDNTEGGNTQRFGAYLTYQQRPSADQEFLLTGYATAYRFRLFSNFTFFSADPVNGDGIEQGDDRSIFGAKGSYRVKRQLFGRPLESTFGVETRGDQIDNVLFQDRARERLSAVVDATIRETSIGVFLKEEYAPASWVRVILGLRGDYFNFDVTDNLEDQASLAGRTSGVEDASLLSPKATLVLSPSKTTDLYLNFGRGFHSNDARGVVRAVDSVTALAAATGYEVGLRTNLAGRIDLAMALFGLSIGSELVWVGDAGETEAKGATQRFGAEFEGRAALWPWLFLDLDATATRATFTELAAGEDQVPLAPRLTMSSGLSAIHPRGFSGRLGLFHLGDRPATEDSFLTAEGFTRLDVDLSYKQPRYQVTLNVKNLTNTEWREAQFANASRLQSEASAADCPEGTRPAEEGGAFIGCEDVHFTPGVPFTVLLGLSLFF